MLPKKKRVTTKEVEEIFKKGIFLNSPSLTFKYFKNNATDHRETKISFIAPKSVAKLAVERNLLRRRGYSALKKNIEKFPIATIGVFIFKKYQDDISTLSNEIKNIFNKLD